MFIIQNKIVMYCQMLMMFDIYIFDGQYKGYCFDYFKINHNFILLTITVMRKNRVINSTAAITRKRKHLHQYFDISNQHPFNPNQRSLPKYKNNGQNPKRSKSGKKQNLVQKRLSQGKIEKPKLKQTTTPQQRGRHMFKNVKHQHSINKQYDSPSKDNQQIDLIFKGTQKKVKGNSVVDSIIEKINEILKQNRLDDAIIFLKNSLQNQVNNQDLQYFLGICYIFRGSYDEAIGIFQQMLKGKFKKNIYLLLSICYKKTNNLQSCQQILNKCIKEFPKYYQSYIYRGKLYLKLKKNELALANFQKAISLDGSKQMAYIGKGDCLRLLQKYEEAKQYYSIAINNKKTNNYLLLRRAICNMEIKKYEQALQDINRLLENDGQDSEALYFKGLIFNKLKKQNQAIICYEQSIKHNSNKRAVTRSIYQITKIKIQNRDYYEALHTLQRASYLDIDEKVVKKFKIFTQGVTAMMKKNYQDGIKILTQLLEDQQKPLSNFLKPLFYSTRAYGYMALQKYQLAKEDLQFMQIQFSLDLPNLYNKFICEGILACNNQKYENALTLFSKAAKALPYRIQPAFYKAVTLICFSVKLIPKQLQNKKRQYLQSAMKTISKVQKIQNNPSLYMIKGLILYALGQSQQAYAELDKCYKQSTKINSLSIYLTGLILAESGKYSDAISQFKSAIQNKQNHVIPEAYLNRAKCLLLEGEVNQAFVDLQSYMAHRETSAQVHVWAGHLLFHIKAYQDANKAYSNVNNLNKNYEVLFYKAKCYLIIKDVLNTLSHLKLMSQIRNQPKILFDYQIIDCLRQCSEQNFNQFEAILKRIKDIKKKTNNSFGHLVKQQDYQFYKGVMYFYLKNYNHALSNFTKALSVLNNLQQRGNYQDDPQLFEDYHSLNYQNQTFSQAQIYYNIALCHFMQMNIKQGGAAIYQAFKLCPQDSNPKIQLEQLLEYLQTVNTVIPSGPRVSMQFQPFPDSNRLCSIFPKIMLPISPGIQSRLSFCLPRVSKPDIVPRYQQKVLEQVSMASIQIKPQAPWIRRSDHGVIFTDEVVRYDIQISESSSSEQQEQQEEQQQQFEEVKQRRKAHYYEDDYQRSEQEMEVEVAPKMTGQQLKQFFKLDNAIQQKLAKKFKKDQ